MAGEVAADRAALSDAPPSLQATSEGIAERSDDGAAPGAGSVPPSVDEQDGEGAPQETLDPAHDVAETTVPEGPSLSEIDRAPEDDPMAAVRHYQRLLAAMPVSDEINTDPGPPMPVALTGEADPGRIGDQAEESEVAFDAEVTDAQAGMQEDEGIDDIRSTLPDELLVAPVAPDAGEVPTFDLGDKPELPSDIRAGMDRGLAPTWTSEIGTASAGHDAAMTERQTAEARERAATDREIAELEAGTASEQEGLRETAHGEVAEARAGWQTDIDAARGTYDGKRQKIDDGLTRDVDARVLLAETDAQGHLDDGQDKAEREKTRVETLAEEKRREAERKRRDADGFLDWLSSKVKSFFAALKKALKDLFDGLRDFVNKAIAAAKKLADAAIELGRKAVIGLIRVAGSALELAADVFLAAFPEARDRAKAAIRSGRERCEQAVNDAAAALRRAVHAALDALGKALLFVIDVYEKFYVGMLEIFEALTLGYIEVTRALIRLNLAAEHSPFELEGQIYQQMIGADLTEPLPFELTSSERAQRDAMANAPVEGLPEGGAVIEATPATGGVPLGVAVDPVLPFAPDPEMFLGHNFDNGALEFPGNPAGASVADLMDAAAANEDAAPAEAVEGAEGPDGVEGAENVDEGPDFFSMTEEEKFEYYKGLEGPKECRTDTPTSPEGEVPLEQKIGPLTRAQRASYMLPKAWDGIKHWAGCNWDKILLGVIAALVVIAAAVAISILTGGTAAAGLGALLTLFTGAMILVAIAQVAGFLKDYLTKSVDGDVVGGGKALAGAFAVAAVEIIFAILTYVTFGAFRALAAAVKGTGRLAAGAVKAAGKAAGNLARRGRSAARGLTRSGTRLGRGANAVAKVGGAFFRRGKLMIRNVRSGFERSVKSVGKLGEKLGKRLPFRRYKIVRKGRFFQLFGSVNPWVLLASGELRNVDPDDLPSGAKIGDEITLPDGSRAKIVGDSNRGGAMKSIDELDDVALRNADDLERTTGRGGKTDANEATWSHEKGSGDLHGVEGSLDELGKGKGRGSAETTAQGKAGKSSGVAGDEGGHAVGHRFMDDQGVKNLFAQAGNFNKSAWKKMENEWAAFLRRGYKIKFRIKFTKHSGKGRPGEVSVVYDVTSPTTGKVMRRGPFDFKNLDGQSFERLKSKTMNW